MSTTYLPRATRSHSLTLTRAESHAKGRTPKGHRRRVTHAKTEERKKGKNEKKEEKVCEPDAGDSDGGFGDVGGDDDEAHALSHRLEHLQLPLRAEETRGRKKERRKEMVRCMDEEEARK